MSFLLLLACSIIIPLALPLIIKKKRLLGIYITLILVVSIQLGFFEQIAINKNTSNPAAPFGMLVFHIVLLSFVTGTFIQALRLKQDDQLLYVFFGYLLVFLVVTNAVSIGDFLGMDVNPNWSGG